MDKSNRNNNIISTTSNVSMRKRTMSTHSHHHWSSLSDTESTKILFELLLLLHHDSSPDSTQNITESKQQQQRQKHQSFFHVLAKSKINNKNSKAATTNANLILLAQGVLHRLSQFDQSLLEKCLLSKDIESGYTFLHKAIIEKNLAVILLILRHVSTLSSLYDDSSDIHDVNVNNLNYLTQCLQNRFKQRPMLILQQQQQNNTNRQELKNNIINSSSQNILTNIVNATDNEGLTPLNLLCQIQQMELKRCRNSIISHNYDQHDISYPHRTKQTHGRIPDSDDSSQEDNEDSDYSDNEEVRKDETQNNYNNFQYGCEVLSFGRTGHYALGVPSTAENTHHYYTSNNHNNNTLKNSTASSPRPQRVQQFALSNITPTNSAVGISVSDHHSLVLTKQGHLYSFGYGGSGSRSNNNNSSSGGSKGKGSGRLGLGDDIHVCLLPTRIEGSLLNRKVINMSAAENHSLCVTSDGSVFGWGSNRFGQLGISNNSNSTSTTGSNTASSSVPRRIECLKSSSQNKNPCIKVAAGTRHSVALTKKGEVLCWGDNSHGQLGRRIHKVFSSTGACSSSAKSSHSSNIHHTYSRVDALWDASPTRKIAIDISASEQSTLVLVTTNNNMNAINSNNKINKVNAVYSWGHGSHYPIKINFSPTNNGASTTNSIKNNNKNYNKINSSSTDHDQSWHHSTPISIACGKYHNASVMSDGSIYTWGLHNEPLGTSHSSSRSKTGSMLIASPQLVTGMLPENGGGRCVAVSVSENHTAVLTDCGQLFTWGASHGSGSMGHAGVKYQPIPRKVPGVTRAVAVASAKEHTMLLMGTSFPSLPNIHKKKSEPLCDHLQVSTSELNNTKRQKNDSLSFTAPPSLLDLAAKQAARQIDLFNVIPIFLSAKRMHCYFLINYCQEFIERNLDGVLISARKSDLDSFLNDHFCEASKSITQFSRHEEYHPLVLDMFLHNKSEGFDRGSETYDFDDDFENNVQEVSGYEQISTSAWIESCGQLLKQIPDALSSRHPLLSIQRKRDRTQSFSRARSRTLSFGGSRSNSFADSSTTATVSHHKNKYNSNLNLKNNHRRSLRQECSDRCIMLTSNMSLRTPDAVQAKYDCLFKEIRGVKKRLNQISQIEDSCKVSDDATNNKGVLVTSSPSPSSTPPVARILATDGLTEEQREKLTRCHMLKADLIVYEDALQIVKDRMKSLGLKKTNALSTVIKETQPATKINEDTLEEKQSSCKVAGDKKEDADVANDTCIKNSNKQLFRCEVCQINCPDANSFALHNGGRKHANRVRKQQELEQKQMAERMMKLKHEQMLKADTIYQERQHPRSFVASKATSNASPWKLQKRANDEDFLKVSLSPEPRYKLNPPSSSKELPINITNVSSASVSPSAWPTPKQQQYPTLSSASGLSNSMGSPSPRTERTVLATSPSTSHATVASSLAITPFKKLSGFNKKNTKKYSLADFYNTPSKSATATTPMKGWASTPTVQTKSSPFSLSSSPPLVSEESEKKEKAKSLLEIQLEEENFQRNRDVSFGESNGTNKWFIEQRERAGSMSQILESEEQKKLEMEALIQEQMKIEDSIRRENQRIENEKKKKKKKKNEKQQQRVSKKCDSTEAPINNKKKNKKKDVSMKQQSEEQGGKNGSVKKKRTNTKKKKKKDIKKTQNETEITNPKKK